jgi:hypothetical protein
MVPTTLNSRSRSSFCGSDPQLRQEETLNMPPIIYLQAGNCFSWDPSLLDYVFLLQTSVSFKQFLKAKPNFALFLACVFLTCLFPYWTLSHINIPGSKFPSTVLNLGGSGSFWAHCSRDGADASNIKELFLPQPRALRASG